MIDTVSSTENDIFNDKTQENRTVTISDIPAKLEEPEVQPVEELLDTIPKIDSFEPEVIEEAPEITEVIDPIPKTNLNKTARYEISVKTLGSYLEMCSVLRNPTRGLNALIFHNQRALRGKDSSFSIIKNIKVYNALLKGFAAKGDTLRLEEVITMIRKENMKLNMQSYIAILECYERANFQDHYLKQIRIYAKEAISNGFTFDKLLNNGTFLNDEREVVLAAMQKYDPKYIPKYAEPVVQYSNELVNSLNHSSQLKLPEITEKRHENGLVTPDSMKLMVEKQLELEKNGQVVVKSIESKGKVSDEVMKFREIMNEHIKDWEETAAKAFNRDLSALTAQKSPLNYEVYMRSIPLKDFVTILVNEAKQIAEGSETYSPTVNQLYRDLGNYK